MAGEKQVVPEKKGTCNVVASTVRSVCAQLLCISTGSAEHAVTQLALSAEQLQLVDGRVDTASTPGRRACLNLLMSIDWAARALRTPPVPRRYREEFTVNYRVLFPDMTARHYRVDIFEAAIQWTGTRWVNGERFDLSQDALRAAEGLQCAWSTLDGSLSLWRAVWRESGSSQVTSSARTELRTALFAFDSAWTLFEHRYIVELIAIEAEARGLVLKAVEEEEKLRKLEAKVIAAGGNIVRGDGVSEEAEKELSALRKTLLASVTRLNCAANLQYKSREDRGSEILEASYKALRRCREEGKPGCIAERGELGVVQVLAEGVLDTFDSVRHYLHEVPRWTDSVHPHLCNNVGLVACMTAWTDSWELGARYMEPEVLLKAVCHLVSTIYLIGKRMPALAAMCDECDVELFMVLPRIVWLRFLLEPDIHLELIRKLVPHYFDEQDPPKPNAELEQFVERFRALGRQLAGRDNSASEERAWEVLISRVVVGPSGGDGSPSSGSANDTVADVTEAVSELRSNIVSVTVLNEESEAAVEAFVHELEKWSMELQRHHPEDWCQCSSVLVRCLAGSPSTPRPAEPKLKTPFCV